jgi:dUTP pyrophosphatase
MLNIGDKVKGFEPSSRMKTGSLPPEKKGLIGEVGTVVAVVGNSVKVDFENKDDQWWFDTEEAEKHKVINQGMEVKVKKMHAEAVIPSYSKPGDAGLDLTAVSEEWNEGNTMVTYGTGLSIEIPEGYVGLLFPRSSVCKTSLNLSNSVGVIDSGYRGEIMLKYRYPEQGLVYDVGDRVGQLIIMPYPQIKLVEAEELSTTERGEGGYGSSGK